MKKIVIFDLDGTILDTLCDLANAVNFALKKHGYQTHELSQYRYFVGNGVRKLVERALPANAQDEVLKNRVFDSFITYYGEHKMDATQPYPGIPELLDNLRHNGMVLAVASNKYHEGACDLVSHYFKSGTFDIVYGHRKDFPAKPAPDVIYAILNDAQLDAKEALYVGDSLVDMCTAKAANVDSVGVTWGFRSQQELLDNGATYIVDQPNDIFNIINYDK